jgi:23S rRNA pseudouridine2605 synthase
MPEARIQKLLADAGVASRRAAELLVAAGRVTVDGRIAVVGERLDPARHAVAVDGRPLPTPTSHVHLVMNKPLDVTSTVRDRHAGRTVLDLVPAALLARAGRLYPVGRLDRDSEGLLLLTNDGAWAERLTHPRYGVEREYAAGLIGPLSTDQARQLREGIRLDEGLARLDGLREATAPETAKLVRLIAAGPADLHWYRATVAQGWRRQLRRVFAAVGAPVARLVRVRIGTLRLEGLGPGEVAELAPQERDRLGNLGRTSVVAAGPAASADPAKSSRRRRLVVSIDGPASSGKSTVGAAAAAELGYRFCDTGLLYRALTWLALERGADLEDGPGLAQLVPEISLGADPQGGLTRVRVGGRDVGPDVHAARVDRHVSTVARQPAVRAALLPRQRELAAAGGIIMAGRDIGTVVLPAADLKFWLEVSVHERARRRAADRGAAPGSPGAEAILAELKARDAVDTTRASAPLRVPPGALVIESDGRDLAETVAAMVAAVRARETS